MPESASTHIWSDIQKSGLLPSVTSLAEYERLAQVGWLLANQYLSELNPDPFAPDTSRNVHELMFGEVHPWAGEFRKPGQSVILGGYPGADSWRIPRELELLQLQTSALYDLLGAKNFSAVQQRALVCAYHHARFERVHPFRDGNGRVGRSLFGAALRQLCGGPFEIAWGDIRPDYFAGLKSANKCDLAPLTNIILTLLNEETVASVEFPFRVAPRMFEGVEQTTIEDDLAWSRNPRA